MAGESFPRELLGNDLRKNTAAVSGRWIVDSHEEGNRAVRRIPDYFKGADALYLEQMEFVITASVSTAV